jgi:Flp pilus assembly pilin Flp
MNTNLMQRLWTDEEASNAVEYGLIAAVIAVALIVAFRAFGTSITGLFNRQAAVINGT